MSAFDPGYLVRLLAPFEGVSRCWVAFSGGLDSTVLLTAAAAMRRCLPGALHAVYIDHGLHPDSQAWADHCRAYCHALPVPLVTRRLALGPVPGESIEALARAARYEAFSDLLAPGDLLLTAHTRDDQAETLLLALLRGSGVHGLAAMPFETDLGAGRLVRPLLDVARGSLAAYASIQGLSWIEDPSNRDLALDRNYLRHAVVPLLHARWPACSKTLARSAGHCAEAAQLTDQLAAETLMTLGGRRPGTLDIPGLMRLERARQRAVLRLWLRRRGFALPDARRLERVLDEVLPARSDADPLVAWSGCEIRRYRHDLFAIPPPPELPLERLEITWHVGDEVTRLQLPPGLGRLEWWPAVETKHALTDPARGPQHKALRVCFRARAQTSRSGPLGQGRRLKKLFQEAGVPVWLRPYVPLVFDADGLVAVAGVVDRRAGPRTLGPSGECRWCGHFWETSGFVFR